MKKMEKLKVLLNVLCLEDVLKDAELLNEMLVDAGYLVSMDIATGEKEYLSFLKGRNYDIILADYTLPGFDVHTALKLALELQPEVPFICASGTISEDKAVELLKQGATDYVFKDRLGRLAFAVRRALEGKEKQKEWKKAEEALRESEVKYRTLVTQSPDGIFIVDLSGTFLSVNKAICDTLKYSEEEFLSIKMWDIVPHQYLSFYSNRLAAIIKGESQKEAAEYEVKGKDGIVHFIEVVSAPYYKDKEIIGLQGIARDITERKRAEEELRESKEQFSQLYENAKIGLYRTTPDGTILLANKALVKMLGYPSFEMLAERNLEKDGFEPTYERKEFLEKIEKDGELNNFESAWVRQDGSVFYVRESAQAIRDSDGTTLYYDGVVEDITERKQAEKVMREYAEQYKTMISATLFGFWLVDEKGKLLDVNDTYCSMSGYTREELLNLSVPDIEVIDKPEDVAARIQRIIESGTDQFESKHKAKDGHAFDVEISTGFLYSPKQFIVFIRDITDRKRAEEEIIMLAHSLRSINECVSITDLEDNIQFVNESLLKTYGYDENELNGKHISILRSLNNPPELVGEIMPATLRGGWKGELWNKRKDGSEFPIYLSTTIINAKDGKPLGLIGVASDITERKLAEETIQLSERKYRGIFESIQDVYFETAIKGTILELSPSIENLTKGQYKRDDLIGKKIYDFFLDPEARLGLILALKENKRILDYEIILKNRDGSSLECSISAIFQFDSSGRMEKIIGTMHDITKRKRAEEELHRIGTAIDQTVDWVVITDRDGIIQYTNPAFTKISGYSREEALGKTPRILKSGLHPPPLKFYETLWKTIIGGEVFSATFTNKNKDGKLFFQEETITPIKDKEDKITHFVSTGKEITERLLAYKALKESEERMHVALKNSPIVVYNQDMELRYTWIYDPNPAFIVEQILGKTDFDILTPEDAAKVTAVKRQVLETGVSTRQEIQFTIAGEEFYYDLTIEPLRDDDGKIIGITCASVEITASKRAEQEIISQKNRFAQLFENSPIAIAMLDAQDKVTFINESFSALFGYFLGEIKGKSIDDLIVPPEFAEEAKSYSDQNREGNQINKEGYRKKKDGSYFSAQIIGVPITIDDRTIGSYGMYVDLTQRKEAEEKMKLAKELAEQSNKLKDEFINNISHEIRTPLNGILGLSNLIKENYIQYVKTEDEELFTGIDFSAERIIRTVDMILNYSRLQTGEFAVITKEIDIFEICERIIKRNKKTAETKNLELILDNRCRETKITGDEYTINEAVTNLVDNALKFTKKGFIKVTLSPGENDGVKLEIKDTGIGISEDYFEHLYEPYRQEKMGYGRPYEGVGLGLAITKRYFELNNAALSVESKKGEGTTFMVEFNKGKHLKINQPENVKSMDYIKPAETKKEKLILVVEDDWYNRDFLKRILDKEFKLLLADSAEEVYALLKDNKIDLILMDISIQGGKNGLELTTELKASKEYQHIPIIAVTAHAFDKDRQNALAAGCNAYLSKPFTKASLLEMIMKFV